jgi:hypothetical protein
MAIGKRGYRQPSAKMAWRSMKYLALITATTKHRRRSVAAAAYGARQRRRGVSGAARKQTHQALYLRWQGKRLA